jgi:hypothetical protein
MSDDHHPRVSNSQGLAGQTGMRLGCLQLSTQQVYIPAQEQTYDRDKRSDSEHLALRSVLHTANVSTAYVDLCRVQAIPAVAGFDGPWHHQLEIECIPLVG